VSSKKKGYDPVRNAVKSLECSRCGRRKAFDDVRCLACYGKGITAPTTWVPARDS